MGFWSIYFPVFAAFLTMEGLNILISYSYTRIQMRKFKAFEEKMRAQGIDPEAVMRSMQQTGQVYNNFNPHNPTISGQVSSAGDRNATTGQYI